MKKIYKAMQNAILNYSDTNSPKYIHYYWLSQLTYTKNTSHPEYAILHNQVENDFATIRKGKDIQKIYEYLGVDFNDIFYDTKKAQIKDKIFKLTTQIKDTVDIDTAVVINEIRDLVDSL